MAESDTENDEKFDQVVHEYYQAVEAGEIVDPEAFIRQHTEHESQLRSFFADLHALDDLPGLGAMDRTIDQSGSRRSHAMIPNVTSRDHVTYIGQYRLLEEIARGGMGVVFKARQEKLSRVVALKMILSGPLASSTEIDRFRREARAAARLQHPNIVSVHEIGQHDGHYFFTMDYVESDSLADRLREGSLGAEESARLVESIARAMHYAHGEGVLHRDLKPANILIDNSGQPHITDFGLAKAQSDVDHETLQEMTRTGQILGTPSYMSPEQASGKSELIDIRSDVYSLGAILYACLVGRAPFVGESSLETLQQVLQGDPPRVRLLNNRVPKDLETICHKALSKEPQHRYATALQLADDAGRFSGGYPILAKPMPRVMHAYRWSRRNPAAASLLGLLLLLALSIPTAAVLYARHEKERAGVEINLREQADRQANAANAARTQTRIALANEKKALATTTKALFESRRNAYRSSLFPMVQAYTNGQFGLLDQLLRDSEKQHSDFAGWEWHFLDRSVRRQFVPFEFEQKYTFVRYAPSARLVAFRRDDGLIDIRHASDLQLIRTLPGDQQNYFAWHPSHPWLAAASGSNRLVVWDVQQGKQVVDYQTKDDRTNMNHRGVAWDPAGRKIALGGHGRTDIFDLEDGDDSTARLKCSGYGRYVEWHPKGQSIAVGGASGVEVLNVQTSARLWRDVGNRIKVGGIAWNKEGNRLAAAWEFPRNRVDVYNQQGKRIHSLKQKTATRSLHWDHATDELIVGGTDQQIHWWPVSSNQPHRSVSIHEANLVSMDVNLGLMSGISIDESGQVQQFPAGEVPRHSLEMRVPTGPSRIYRCQWHPKDPRFIALQSECFVHIVDTLVAKIVQTFGTTNRFIASAWHPTESVLATIEVDGIIRCRSVSTGEELQSLQASSHGFFDTLEYDAEGKRLLVGRGNGHLTAPAIREYSAELIDLSGGTRDFYGPEGKRNLAALSADGRRLVIHKVIEGSRAKVGVWDTSTGNLMAESPKVPLYLHRIAIHPESQFVALGGPGILIIMDMETGDFIKQFNAHVGPFRSLDWSPDGKRLLTSADDNTLKLWTSDTLELIARFEREMGAVSSWSPHGNKIATCTPEGMLRVYASDSWEPSWPVVEGETKIEGEDLRRLYAGSGDIVVQDMKSFSSATWSGDQQLLWIDGNLGAELRLGFEVKKPATFELSMLLTTASDFGIFDLYLDDKLLEKEIDLFRPGDDSTVGVIEKAFGSVELAAGQHRLRVILKGSHEKAKRRHGFGLDRVDFHPSK